MSELVKLVIGLIVWAGVAHTVATVTRKTYVMAAADKKKRTKILLSGWLLIAVLTVIF